MVALNNSPSQLTVAIDTETELIAPGKLAPRLVCVSYAFWSYSTNSIVSGLLKEREDIAKNIKQWLTGASEYHKAVTIVGHNTAYDMAVLAAYDPELLPLIFKAYELENIEDTQLVEQLLDIANGTFWRKRKAGGYTLKTLSENRLGLNLSKDEDSYRLRYGELIDTPLSEWPKAATDYAIGDAEATYKVFLDQKPAPNSRAQAAAAWALHLMSCWGVVTCPSAVNKFTSEVSELMSTRRAELIKSGVLRENGSKDLAVVRQRVVQAVGTNVKKTAKGNISTDEETLTSTGDPDLKLLVEFSKAQKLDSVWGRYLKQGTNKATPVQASFHCLVESGRTSCSKPNLQNPHRATGLRECFVPREGMLFIACDYSTLELCTLAQVNTWLFRDCNMADKLREGADLHLHFAAQLLNITYAEALSRLKKRDRVVKKTRQMAKVANFGYPGGMGAASFRNYAKGYGLHIDEKLAEQLRKDWFATWPEMELYFKFIHNLIGQERGKVTQFISDRVRGDVGFTQACNTFFQGLAADGAKAALFEVSQRCYSKPASYLYGSRPIMFIHDEIVLETPANKAAAAADELAKTMSEVMREFTPDIPIKTEVALMDRWYKDAEEVRDSSGKLLKWEPGQ